MVSMQRLTSPPTGRISYQVEVRLGGHVSKSEIADVLGDRTMEMVRRYSRSLNPSITSTVI